MGRLRELAAPFVALGPSGVAIRDRLKCLTAEDEKVLRLVGDLLGTLAARDLKARCAAGLDHDSERWAERKRSLTQESSSRWAGSITKATHDQWALARRGQFAHVQSLEAGIATITHRLSLPVEEKGTKQAPGGYRSRREWFAKSRRRALGHPIRRRTAPPRTHQSDGCGHRTVQARSGSPGREGHRPRIPGPRTRSVPPGRGANAVDQNAQHRPGRSAEHEPWQQASLPLSLQERFKEEPA
ncbi:hypothetical protein [Streptomyces shenzhenensis]|uniref:hypothetical protein n=1 Tax=Streptomyces shenzhenensis TaxID=943815 RepID=UPI0015F11265|nr:hypothetical protein [Streptomyces shenzhenensis]